MQPEVDKFRSIYHAKSLVASVGRDKFLQLDLLKLKKDNPREFVIEMIVYYDIFAFFPDEEIIEKFKSVGFKRQTLQWFIPLEDILQKWEDILLKEEVGLFDGTCFEMIDIFINLKIKKEILTWAIKELPLFGFEQYTGLVKMKPYPCCSIT